MMINSCCSILNILNMWSNMTCCTFNTKHKYTNGKCHKRRSTWYMKKDEEYIEISVTAIIRIETNDVWYQTDSHIRLTHNETDEIASVLWLTKIIRVLVRSKRYLLRSACCCNSCVSRVLTESEYRSLFVFTCYSPQQRKPQFQAFLCAHMLHLCETEALTHILIHTNTCSQKKAHERVSCNWITKSRSHSDSLSLIHSSLTHSLRNFEFREKLNEISRNFAKSRNLLNEIWTSSLLAV